MATPILNGLELVLFDSSVLGLTTDWDFTADKEKIDITTMASGGNKEFMTGDKTYEFGFSALVSKTTGDSSRGYDYVMDSFVTNDSAINFAVKPSFAGNTYYDASALLTNVAVKGSGNDKITYSGKLTVTGKLNKKTS
jgi:hypothetical protein